MRDLGSQLDVGDNDTYFLFEDFDTEWGMNYTKILVILGNH